MQVIDGKYRCIKKIAQGMSGVVYLVESDSQRVALKQLKMASRHFTPEETLENFKREFMVLKELNHPHILRILDFGYDSAQDLYYFTTEYLSGGDIFLATRDHPPEEIEEYFVQILRALSYLHSRKVYHFDIKPGNILIQKQSDGQSIAKLIDFGLSAFRKKGLALGTPAYSPPEVYLDELLDGRADLYSLGVTWYECLTGENPFRTMDVGKTLERHRTFIPPPVSSHSHEIPPYLDPILSKLLRKYPAERYHQADQVIRDLNLSGSHHYPLETALTALAYLPREGKLVGRKSEWEQLLSLFDRVFITRSDSRSAIVLTGPLGTGKSRLLRELKYHAQIHEVPVVAVTDLSQFQLLSETVLLVDDANVTTLEKVQSWMRQFHRHNFLVVIAGEDLKEASAVNFFTIHLDNFDRNEVAKYVASVLSVDDPPDFLVSELYARTEGNPLLLTELVDAMIQSHQIFDDQGRWSPSVVKEMGIDFKQLRVPKTLTEYCDSKYHRLPTTSQKILAAVALSRLPLNRSSLAKLGLEDVETAWKLLEDERLMAVNPTGGEIMLLNTSFRDWIPQNVPPAEISSLHQVLGEMFLKDPHTRPIGHYHLGFGTGSQEERFQHLWSCGEHLTAENQWSEAASIFHSASTLAPTVEGQFESMLRRGKSLIQSGHTAEVLSLLTELGNFVKNQKTNPEKWRLVQKTLREMGSLYLMAGSLKSAEEVVAESRILLEIHGGDPVEQIILDNFQGSFLMREGRLEEAAKSSEETHKHWSALPIETRRFILNNELPTIYMTQGKYAKAKTLFESYSQFFEEVGHKVKRAYTLYGWAECCYALNQFEEALEIFDQCLKLAEQLKDGKLLFLTLTGLGNVAYQKEDWSRAKEHYQHALDLAQRHASLDSSLVLVFNLAIVCDHEGDHDMAALYLRHMIHTLERQTSLSVHQFQFLTRGHLELGRIFLDREQWVEARDAYRDALRVVRERASLEKFRSPALIGAIKASLYMERHQEAFSLLKELEKEHLSKEDREELDRLRQMFDQIRGEVVTLVT